jgi:uncharacterized SAM-binding protein YcdF (DUF218 family)
MNLPYRTPSQTPDSSPGKPRAKLWGMLMRKERWGLSWKGRAPLAATALAAGLIIFFNIHPFLAVTQRVDTRVLVVEGWVHDFTFEAAVKEFRTGSYDQVFATGGPIVGQGGYTSDSHTYASIGAQQLVKAGIPKELVQMVPSRVMERDRTYSSAVALRDWFHGHNMSVRSINVLTEEYHARRSWLLFQEVFGKEVKVGIISVPSPDYNANYWWKYSEGVREVIDEGIAYVYAKLFFWPGKEKVESGN